MPSMELAPAPHPAGENAAPARPTSAVLADLLAVAPPASVTLDWIIGGLGPRSYGLVMLLLGLASLAPGLGGVTGLLVIWMASQMVLARPVPSVPRFLSRRTVPTRRFVALVRRLIPVLLFLERFIHPRWPTPFAATRRGLGVLLLLLGLSVLSPIPFTQYLPALIIMGVAIAYLEGDGMMLAVALAAGLFSIAVTAAEIWAAYQGARAL